MTLNSLKSTRGTRKGKKRVGRGMASKGKTSGRGHKGQRARSGGRGGLTLLGMRQTLLRVPKTRGFKSPNPDAIAVNLGDLAEVGTLVTPKTLKKAGLIDSTRVPVKILAGGELTASVVVRRCQVSKEAKQKIEAAGGKVE